MPSYNSVDVKCPFYRGDDGKKNVTCEGVCEGNKLIMAFGRKKDFEIQMRVFCCEHYHRCEIYKVVSLRFNE